MANDREDKNDEVVFLVMNAAWARDKIIAVPTEENRLSGMQLVRCALNGLQEVSEKTDSRLAESLMRFIVERVENGEDSVPLHALAYKSGTDAPVIMFQRLIDAYLLAVKAGLDVGPSASNHFARMLTGLVTLMSEHVVWLGRRESEAATSGIAVKVYDGAGTPPSKTSS